MAKKGLREWVKENWVDIANKRWDGSYPCGRMVEKKEKIIQNACPLAKARRMTKSQSAGAVRRKQAKSNTGGKPTNVATFAKRKRMSWEV